MILWSCWTRFTSKISRLFPDWCCDRSNLQGLRLITVKDKQWLENEIKFVETSSSFSIANDLRRKTSEMKWKSWISFRPMYESWSTPCNLSRYAAWQKQHQFIHRVSSKDHSTSPKTPNSYPEKAIGYRPNSQINVRSSRLAAFGAFLGLGNRAFKIHIINSAGIQHVEKWKTSHTFAGIVSLKNCRNRHADGLLFRAGRPSVRRILDPHTNNAEEITPSWFVARNETESKKDLIHIERQ